MPPTIFHDFQAALKIFFHFEQDSMTAWIGPWDRGWETWLVVSSIGMTCFSWADPSTCLGFFFFSIKTFGGHDIIYFGTQGCKMLYKSYTHVFFTGQHQTSIKSMEPSHSLTSVGLGLGLPALNLTLVFWSDTHSYSQWNPWKGSETELRRGPTLFLIVFSRCTKQTGAGCMSYKCCL